VRHVTRYDYGEAVPVSHHLVHLSPRPHPRQRCRRNTLTLEPAASIRVDQIDYYGNPVSYFAIQEPHHELAIIAETEIEVVPPPLFEPGQTLPWELVRAQVRAAAGGSDHDSVAQFAFASVMITPSRELLDFATPSFPRGRPVGEAVLDLTLRIHREFTFDPSATTTATPLHEVLTNRRGVCQDFAHLQIGCLRSLGLAARYVSGYLRTLPPPGRPRLIGADASHAWLSLWCGNSQWVDFCPTNGRLVDTDFITIAWGRDFDDVSPAHGVIYAASTHSLEVSVDVEPVE